MSIYKIHLLFIYPYARHLDIGLHIILNKFIQVHNTVFSLWYGVGTLSIKELLSL